MAEKIQIVKKNEQTLEWAGVTRMVAGPIIEYHVIGDRIIIFFKIPRPKEQDREGFCAYAIAPERHARNIGVSGTVESGVRLSLLPDSLNGFVTPAGVRVDTPGQVQFISQLPQGCVVLLNNRDVPKANVMMYGDDGKKAWTIGPNPFTKTSWYSHLEVAHEELRVIIELGWQRFRVDPCSGAILSKV